MSNVPQCSTLGPVLFNIFINGLDRGAECTLSKSVDNVKLGGVAYLLEGHASIQRDFNRLGKWANRNTLEFNKEKCRVLHVGKNIPRNQGMLGSC